MFLQYLRVPLTVFSVLRSSTVVTVTFEETSYQTVEGEPITAQLRADTCFVGTISVTLEAIVGSADGELLRYCRNYGTNLPNSNIIVKLMHSE